MTAHEEDRDIELLRDAVPTPPDVADRITAVKRRAGRQRTQLWTQGLGAAASVLLVVGVAAAVAGPGQGRPVRPAADPLAGLAATFAKQKSVAFEARTTPVGPVGGFPQMMFQPGGGEADSAKALTMSVKGAVSVDGTGWAEGDVSALGFFMGMGSEDFRVRLVDGGAYRSIGKPDHAPPGKNWARSDVRGEDLPGAVEIERALRLATAVAEDVRYVRSTTVRGTQVAEYVFRVPERYTNGAAVSVNISLDEDGLPRRLATEVSLTELFELNEQGMMFGGGMESPAPIQPNVVKAELELFDYGKDVEVSAPPAAEVISDDDLMEISSRRMDMAQDRLEQCVEAAGTSEDKKQACLAEFVEATGYPESLAEQMLDYQTREGGDMECEPSYDPATGMGEQCSIGIGGDVVHMSPSPADPGYGSGSEPGSPPPPAATASPSPR